MTQPIRSRVVLAAGRERSLLRRHPWVLSGSVARVEGNPEPGAWVAVCGAEGRILAHGHFSPASSIRVRLLTFGADDPGEAILEARIHESVERRAALALGPTDALRLVNAEGDGLPGLVVDRYADAVVARFGTVGMACRRERIAAALAAATGAAAGIERADGAAARREGFPQRDGALWGSPPHDPVEIRERDRLYAVDVLAGQKTGFYLDQRDARDRIAALSAGRHVLDVFAYSGGFAVAAARGGAERVSLIESSAAALDLAKRNLTANAPAVPLTLRDEDAFQALRSDRENYGGIVIAPPPLARRRDDVRKASRAYKDLLMAASRRVAPGGWIAAFTCSHHVDPLLFEKIAAGAAVDAGRSLRRIGSFGAPADHPVDLAHPEGRYLYGLLLQA